jgi:3-hydroxyanthranilate 3,4-dioxygenase
MARRPQYDTLAQIGQRGSYDEYPIFPPGKDPQLCLSRNRGPQPFHLICEHDTILAQISGSGRITFRNGEVRYFDMKPGDFVYIPAGYASRYTAAKESIQYRYKAEKPGLEAVAWFCPKCDAELHRETWDTAREISQEGYIRATSRFNTEAALRTCKSCGTVHPQVDVSASKWAEVAIEMRAELGGTAQPPTGEALEIRPHPWKQPKRENVYWQARNSYAQLIPMFPYLDAGSIVPCISVFYGGPGTNVGHFVHDNTLDEVFLNFGSVQSYIKPGFARIGTKTHGVGSFETADPPDGMATINVITQRHPIGEHQHESIIYLCKKCKHEILRRDYDGNPPPQPGNEYYTPDLPTLATIIESATTAETYNALGENEINCPKCGEPHHRFPLKNWGWDEYKRRTRATLSAMRSMNEATANAGAPVQKPQAAE